MTVPDRPESCTDRDQLLKEIALWRQDVSFWRREYHRALNDLRQLKEALREREQILEAHAEALSRYEERLAMDPETPGEPGWGSPSEPHGPSVAPTEVVKHSRHRDLHERVKRQHHTALAYWSLLLKELGKLP